MKKIKSLDLSAGIVFYVAVVIMCFTIVQSADCQLNAIPKSEKQRVIVLTDIGEDPDDQQSMTHLLMYADQIDIEGLIATGQNINPGRPELPNKGEPQPHNIVNFVEAYGQVRENLLKHSEGWPETDALLGMIKSGANTGRTAGDPDAHRPLDQLLGEGKDTEASKHIIEVVDRDDPRPVWVSIWGGPIDLAQALWRVRNDRSQEEVQKFIDKLRVYAWGHQDKGGPWIQENFPDLFYIVSTGGIVYSTDVNLRNQEWLDTHVRFNHGPVGALCPLRNNQYGAADSQTYMGLIPNGLSVMERPDWGGWGGRMKKSPGSETQWIDVTINTRGSANRGPTVSRWAPQFQNDFQARMDWCVKEFDEANHPPQPVLNGDESLHPIEINAKAGQRIFLDATGSSDIDNDALFYQWRFYTEAGNYLGWIDFDNANNVTSSFVVPKDASNKTLHVILVLTDNGSPALTRYRRLVVNVN